MENFVSPTFSFDTDATIPWKVKLYVILSHIFLLLLIGLPSPKPFQLQQKKLIVKTVVLKGNKMPLTVASPPIIDSTEPIEETPVERIEEMEKQFSVATELVIPEENNSPPLDEIQPIPKETIAAVEQEIIIPQKKPAAIDQKLQSKKQATQKPVKKPIQKKKIEPKKAKSQNKVEKKQVQKSTKTKQSPQNSKTAQQEKPNSKSLPQKKASIAKNQATVANAKKQAFIDEALQKLNGSSKTNQTAVQRSNETYNSVTSPLPIGTLASEAICSINIEENGPTTVGERSYYSELIHRLKLSLKLPEYGEVKLQLTLARSGKVNKITIISAKSNRNKEYIQKALPHLHFPSFGSHFGAEQEHLFYLHLSNELNY